MPACLACNVHLREASKSSYVLIYTDMLKSVQPPVCFVSTPLFKQAKLVSIHAWRLCLAACDQSCKHVKFFFFFNGFKGSEPLQNPRTQFQRLKICQDQKVSTDIVTTLLEQSSPCTGDLFCLVEWTDYFIHA